MKRSIARFVYILIGFIMFSLSLSANDSMQTQRWGLFIGANDGGRGLERLRYADDDAQSLASTLNELGGIPASHSEILIDPNASEVLEALERLSVEFSQQPSSVKKEIIFYYSGHADEEGMILGNQKLAYAEVKRHLQALNAEVTVAVLDSCSSGAFTRAKGGVHRAPFMLDDSVNAQGHAYLTSSSASEISQESDLIGGSFFTYFLIAGLRGAADTNSDGRITLNELYQHSYNETINRTLETGGVQHPTYEINLSGSGDLVMTDINQPSSVLILDTLLEGQFFIKNTQGALVLEMEKPMGQAFPLALPAGEYVVQVVQSTGVSRSAPVQLAPNSSFTLSPMDMTPMGLENARSRGEMEVDLEDDDSIKINTEDGFILISREGIEVIRNDLQDMVTNTEVQPEVLPAERDPSQPLGQWIQQNRRYNQEVAFALTFVPGLSTYPVTDRLVNTELGFIAHAGALDGLQLGYIGAHTNDHSIGFQGAGVYAINSGSFAGAQMTGTYSHISGDLEGAQLAGVGSFTRGYVEGAQISGVANAAGSYVEGAQIGGVVNVAAQTVEGAQIAGVVNVSRGDFQGFQSAGVVNYINGNMDGAQIAGVLNITRGDAEGVQIGLINIANSLDGMPIGLLNFYKEGITTFGVWTGVEEPGDFSYSLMTGNDWFYNHFFMGAKDSDMWSDPDAYFGFGLGVRSNLFSGIALDVDMNYKTHIYQSWGSSTYDKYYGYEEPEPGYDPAEESSEPGYWEESWGDTNTLLGRAVLTTTWRLQPYWGYSAELRKSSLIEDEQYVYYPSDEDFNGYAIVFNMIMGIRMDLY